MEKATERQLAWIKKNIPSALKDNLSKEEAYSIINKSINKEMTSKKIINEAVLGMCFKLSKKFNQDCIQIYDEFYEIKAKLESR